MFTSTTNLESSYDLILFSHSLYGCSDISGVLQNAMNGINVLFLLPFLIGYIALTAKGIVMIFHQFFSITKVSFIVINAKFSNKPFRLFKPVQI